MFTTSVVLASLIGLVGVVGCGVAVWTWRTVAQVRERLGSLEGFAGMHFER